MCLSEEQHGVWGEKKRQRDHPGHPPQMAAGASLKPQAWHSIPVVHVGRGAQARGGSPTTFLVHQQGAGCPAVGSPGTVLRDTAVYHAPGPCGPRVLIYYSHIVSSRISFDRFFGIFHTRHL